MFSSTSIFGSIRKSKSKNRKNDFKQEKCHFKMRFNKIIKFLRFPRFQFGAINELENSEISERFLIVSIELSVGRLKFFIEF